MVKYTLILELGLEGQGHCKYDKVLKAINQGMQPFKHKSLNNLCKFNVKYVTVRY